MLHLLFMILKILGILLLVIFGILLLLLLIVLFVPVRYAADVSFDGKPKVSVLVSWFLHLLTVRVRYDDGAKVLVKALWLRLFDSTEESPEEDENPRHTGEKPAEAPRAEDMQRAAEPPKTADTPKATGTPKTVASQKAVSQPEKTEGSHPKTEKSSPIQKVVQKVSGFWHQIRGNVDAGQEKLRQIRTFLSNEENQKTIRLLWRQLKKLIRHIFPRKIGGRVRFGLDDPASTGQVLTYISPFYGLYAETLEIEPVFEEKVLEGEVHVKGQIRLAGLLWIAARTCLNKNFRLLLKKFTAHGKT